jgi:zinc transporter
MSKSRPVILHAFEIQACGQSRPLTEESLGGVISEGAYVWLHVDVNNPRTLGFLRKHYSQMDHGILKSLLAGETRPRLQESGSGSLIILRGVNHNDPDEPEDMVSVRVWAEEKLVISAQRRSLKSIRDIDDLALAGNGPPSPGAFLVFLVSRLLERMDPVIAELDERLDVVEEAVISDPELHEHKELSSIRKEAILYRRYITPQREAISQICHSTQGWLGPEDKRHLHDKVDNIIRLIEDLDTSRERAQVIKDELTNALSHQMNRNLYLLSVIAAVFLPLGFLTGLFGINLAGMPGAENVNAFYIFSGLLAIVVAIQVWVFKRMKLF